MTKLALTTEYTPRYFQNFVSYKQLRPPTFFLLGDDKPMQFSKLVKDSMVVAVLRGALSSLNSRIIQRSMIVRINCQRVSA